MYRALPVYSGVVAPTMYHDVLGELSPSSTGFQRYIVQIRVQRRYMYFVWNVGVYMFVISLLGLTTWAVDPADVGQSQHAHNNKHNNNCKLQIAPSAAMFCVRVVGACFFFVSQLRVT